MPLTSDQQDCRNVVIYFEVFLKKLKRGYTPDEYDFREYKKQLEKFKECFEVKDGPK
jgi:hypothetical protein